MKFKKLNLSKILLIALLAVIAVFTARDYSNYLAQQSAFSFESCVSAGGKTTKGQYPKICATRQGAFFYDYFLRNQPLDNITTTEFSQQSFSNWRTFSDEFISFKYPSSHTLVQDKKYNMYTLNYYPKRPGLTFYYEELNGKNVKDFLTDKYINTDDGRGITSEEVAPIKVGDYMGYQATTIIGGAGGDWQYITLESPQGGHAITIESPDIITYNNSGNFSREDLTEKDRNTFRQILSTIKFTK